MQTPSLGHVDLAEIQNLLSILPFISKSWPLDEFEKFLNSQGRISSEISVLFNEES